MRCASLLALLLLLGTDSIAQPSLSAGSISYQPGDSFTERICPWVDQGPSGANQVWDFSALSPFVNFNMNWVAPGGFLTSYPTATVVYQSQSYFGIYEAGPTAFRFLGEAEGITLTSARLLDPVDEIRYPFSFGDSYTDAFSGWSYFQSNGGTQDSTEVSGTLSVTFDAYGELVLPWGTVPGAIRLHKTRVTTSAGVTKTEDEYRYYEPGVHHPWLRIVRRTSTASPDVTEFARYCAPIGANTPETSSTVAPAIAPNPTDGLLTISDPSIAPGTRIAVRELSGRTVRAAIARQHGRALLDAEGLGSGAYVLTFIVGGEVRTARFIKQ